MSDLVAFLAARYDEIEADARAAIEAIEEHGESFWSGVFSAYNEGYLSKAEANHIGRHDPARVLREVAAKRKILAIHCQREDSVWCSVCDPGELDSDAAFPCTTLRALAAIDGDHPEYNPGWRS